jgi:hypothetical protein
MTTLKYFHSPKPSRCVISSDAMRETGTSNVQTRAAFSKPSTDMRKLPANPFPSFEESKIRRMYVEFAGPTSMEEGFTVRQSHDTVHRETWTTALVKLRISTIRVTGSEPDRRHPKSAEDVKMIGSIVFRGVVPGVSTIVSEQPNSNAEVNNAPRSTTSPKWRHLQFTARFHYDIRRQPTSPQTSSTAQP